MGTSASKESRVKGVGSEACVVQPPLPCRPPIHDNNNTDTTTVGKVFFTDGYDREHETQAAFEKYRPALEPYFVLAVNRPGRCTVDVPAPLQGTNACGSSPATTSYMFPWSGLPQLVYPDAGVSMDALFVTHNWSPHPHSFYIQNVPLGTWVSGLMHLLKGLAVLDALGRADPTDAALHPGKYTHGDVRPSNIAFQLGSHRSLKSIKFIDFGGGEERWRDRVETRSYAALDKSVYAPPSESVFSTQVANHVKYLRVFDAPAACTEGLEPGLRAAQIQARKPSFVPFYIHADVYGIGLVLLGLCRQYGKTQGLAATLYEHAVPILLDPNPFTRVGPEGALRLLQECLTEPTGPITPVFKRLEFPKVEERKQALQHQKPDHRSQVRERTHAARAHQANAKRHLRID